MVFNIGNLLYIKEIWDYSFSHEIKLKKDKDYPVRGQTNTPRNDEICEISRLRKGIIGNMAEF